MDLSYLGYLGEVDVSKEVVKFLRVLGLMNRVMPANAIRRKTHIRVCNTLAMPMLICGCEVWALRMKTSKK